jgi:hypothetical protein
VAAAIAVKIAGIVGKIAGTGAKTVAIVVKTAVISAARLARAVNSPLPPCGDGWALPGYPRCSFRIIHPCEFLLS